MGDSTEKAVILKQGVDAELLGVPGAPTVQDGKIVDPLTDPKYKINFVGIQGGGGYNWCCGAEEDLV